MQRAPLPRTSLVSRLTATSATPALCSMVILSPHSHMLIVDAFAAASMSSWSLVRCEARKLDLRPPDAPGRYRDRSAQDQWNGERRGAMRGEVVTWCRGGCVESYPQLHSTRPPHLLFFYIVVDSLWLSAWHPDALRGSPRSGKSSQAGWASHRGKLLKRRGCLMLEHAERHQLGNLREQRWRREQLRGRILPHHATCEATKVQTPPRQVVHVAHFGCCALTTPPRFLPPWTRAEFRQGVPTPEVSCTFNLAKVRR